MMSKHRSTRSHCAFLCLAFTLIASGMVFAQTPSFVTFDAPDAGVGNLQGTFPTSINRKGTIAGYYLDQKSAYHGFFRDSTGQITEFDVPGLSNPIPLSINLRGQIVGNGTRVQVALINHGWLRNPNGHFILIDPPGSTFTSAGSINDSGEIAGTYEDAAQVLHGFIRDAHGNYTIVDDPESIQAASKGTQIFAMNANGVTVGNYDDQNTGNKRAFVRDQFGNFTNFDPLPGGGEVGVVAVGINLGGEIAGDYYTSDLFTHGFVRDPSGVVTDFDLPNSTGTFPTAINDNNIVLGQWSDNSFNLFGFERDASGNLTSFGAPVQNQGIYPDSINLNGKITGYYFDMADTAHGFLR